MDMRRLGNSGLTVSVVGLGCNNLGRAGTATETAAGAAAVVKIAIDAGITLFDTADSYGKIPGLSEELLGRALGTRREDVVVATKFGMDMGATNCPDHGARGSRGYIIRAVEASLSRLRTDWIDLYQFQRPRSNRTAADITRASPSIEPPHKPGCVLMHLDPAQPGQHRVLGFAPDRPRGEPDREPATVPGLEPRKPNRCALAFPATGLTPVLLATSHRTANRLR